MSPLLPTPATSPTRPRARRNQRSPALGALALLSAMSAVFGACGAPSTVAEPRPARAATLPQVNSMPTAPPLFTSADHSAYREHHRSARNAQILARDALEHVGAIEGLRFEKLAHLVDRYPVSCVDGRDGHEVLGTPGGDAGEFLLALAALEAQRDAPLTDASVARLLRAYLDAFEHFYLHTDDDALARLRTALLADPRVRAALPADATLADVARLLEGPPVAVREAVLEQLVRPEHVGCGHLRLTMQHPEQYGVRPGLTAAVLRAYFEARWDEVEGVRFDVLHGDHDERAVLQVEIDEVIEPWTKIPLVPPRTREQMFVLHPQVSEFLREMSARLFVDECARRQGGCPEPEVLRERMRELGAQQLAATVAHLAPALPVIALRVTPGSPPVIAARVVSEGDPQVDDGTHEPANTRVSADGPTPARTLGERRRP
jgi:hypothetical protein